MSLNLKNISVDIHVIYVKGFWVFQLSKSNKGNVNLLENAGISKMKYMTWWIFIHKWSKIASIVVYILENKTLFLFICKGKGFFRKHQQN